MADFRDFFYKLRGALVALVGCFVPAVFYAATIDLSCVDCSGGQSNLYTSQTEGVYLDINHLFKMTPVIPNCPANIVLSCGGENAVSVPTSINASGSYFFSGYYSTTSGDIYPNGARYVNSYGELLMTGNTVGVGYNGSGINPVWYAQFISSKRAIKLDSSGADSGLHGSEFVYMDTTNFPNQLFRSASGGSVSEQMTTSVHPIVVPFKRDRVFAGYFEHSDGNGAKYIGYDGFVTQTGLDTVNGCSGLGCVWYAHWCDEGQVINEQTGECGCPTGYSESSGIDLDGKVTSYIAYESGGGEPSTSGGHEYIGEMLSNHAQSLNSVFGTGFGSGAVFGRSMCSETGGTVLDTLNYMSVYNSSTDPDSNISCWCNLTGYSSDDETVVNVQSDYWVLVDDNLDDCEKNCSKACANAHEHVPDFWPTVLGINYCIANQYEVRYYCDENYFESGEEPVTTDTVYYNQSGYSFDFANNGLVAGCGQTGHHVDSYKCYNINTGLQVNDGDVNPWHIASDVYCIPSWAPNVHSVNYNCNNGELGTNGSGTNPTSVVYNFGAQVQVASGANGCQIPQSGYIFDGWSCSGATVTGNTFTMPDNDVTCTARWKQNEFEITLQPYSQLWDNSNHAFSAPVTNTGTAKVYSKLNVGAYLDSARTHLMTTQATTGQYPITKPERTGFYFAGYGYSPQGVFLNEEPWQSYITLYIDADGYITDEGINRASIVDEDEAWEGVWTPKTYNITYHDCNDAESVTYEDALVYGQTFMVNSMGDMGWDLPAGTQFLHWRTAGADPRNYYYAAQLYRWATDDNLDLYAVCKTLTYNVTYDCNTSDVSSVTPTDSTNYVVGNTVHLPVDDDNTCVKDGYLNIGWSCAANGTPVTITSDSFTMPSGNVTCTAQWGEIYHIHYMTTYSYQNGDQEGLVWSPGLMPGTYISGVGENIGALTHSNPNRVFLGWCVGTTEYVSDCNDYANYVNGYQIPTTQTGDLRMYAKWQYNLTFDENAPSNDITVTGMPAVNPVNLTYRDTYILPELSADDYEFIGWSCKQDDNNSTVSGIILGNGDIQITMPAADVTCTAQWASTVYLDWRLNGGSWAMDANENTLSNQPSCEYGTNTMGPVYKPVRTGYNFTGWTVTGHTDSPPGGGGT